MPDMLDGPDGAHELVSRCTCHAPETLMLVGGEPMCSWCAACTALDPAALRATAAVVAEIAAVQEGRDA